jgi:hypothetical protein
LGSRNRTSSSIHPTSTSLHHPPLAAYCDPPRQKITNSQDDGGGHTLMISIS